MKKIIFVSVTLLLFVAACKNNPKKAKVEPVKQETPAPAIADTTVQNNTETEISEPEPAPEPDKYFLIAGSFANLSNAEALQKKLTDQGFNSQVIVRNTGINSEFYKVSYMGFRNKKEAIAKMKEERLVPGKEDVWVLVKK
ncbi:SPOR domain-containing protein [Thermophagus xiamenensis]|jgi:cell division protein FtsN|uniref:Sporulation related domain-containing protein n=1 Tax=Thermophagus xiamenensis TaxID=385682 RepID=A0A1I2CW31_9BACT|nr:SPOR domain-containing protein [Thermophagus xiamenensis]SFE72494.1 Sporulation related domain-containing protein [Thermophagus xiamenensis]